MYLRQPSLPASWDWETAVLPPSQCTTLHSARALWRTINIKTRMYRGAFRAHVQELRHRSKTNNMRFFD